MAVEQGLFVQVVMIFQKESDNKKGKGNTKTNNFQGTSGGSIRWFDLDHECLEEMFITREPDFYKNFTGL